MPMHAIILDTYIITRQVNITFHLIDLSFPSIAAILVVLLPTITAPSKKVAVAATFFAVGSTVAIYMGISLEEWVVFGFALTSGSITLYSIYAYQNKRKNA